MVPQKMSDSLFDIPVSGIVTGKVKVLQTWRQSMTVSSSSTSSGGSLGRYNLRIRIIRVSTVYNIVCGSFWVLIIAQQRAWVTGPLNEGKFDSSSRRRMSPRQPISSSSMIMKREMKRRPKEDEVSPFNVVLLAGDLKISITNFNAP